MAAPTSQGPALEKAYKKGILRTFGAIRQVLCTINNPEGLAELFKGIESANPSQSMAARGGLLHEPWDRADWSYQNLGERRKRIYDLARNGDVKTSIAEWLFQRCDGGLNNNWRWQYINDIVDILNRILKEIHYEERFEHVEVPASIPRFASNHRKLQQQKPMRRDFNEITAEELKCARDNCTFNTVDTVAFCVTRTNQLQDRFSAEIDSLRSQLEEFKHSVPSQVQRDQAQQQQRRRLQEQQRCQDAKKNEENESIWDKEPIVLNIE